MKDKYVFTDDKSSKVLHYSNQGDCLTELKLPSRPYDVDQMNNTSDSNNIFIINTDDMTLCHTVDNPWQVHGICHVNEVYILACGDTLTWINS